MTKVFFRDDDVGELTQPLRTVVELLVDEGVPCSYQVVPSFLTDDAAAWMCDVRAHHPELVFLNQHGFRHEQTIGGERRYSEFDGGRPRDEQKRDIEQGCAMLRERLGEHFDAHVFTPPCHKYDDNTVRVLGELGFRVLSAGVKVDAMSRLYYGAGHLLGRVSLLGKRVSYHGRATPVQGVSEVSVCIDVDEGVDAGGNKLEKSCDELWAEFEVCRARLSVVGVMLHHQECEGPRPETLQAFVQRLKADPSVDFATLDAVAAATR